VFTLKAMCLLWSTISTLVLSKRKCQETGNCGLNNNSYSRMDSIEYILLRDSSDMIRKEISYKFLKHEAGLNNI
jgi:hypothetical protein